MPAGKAKEASADRIRVLIGEDSAFMRRMIADALESDPGIEVVGTAANGRQVLKKLVDLRPDCVTLDLEMPRMDGLETLRFIMSEWPTPVVILSGHTAEGARMALTCLEYGAVDFVEKISRGMNFPVKELLAKVRMAAGVDAGKVRFSPVSLDLKPERKAVRESRIESMVLIGASTGGPQALMEVIPRLPADLPAAVVVVQHMPPDFTRYLAERLDARSAIEVVEAIDGERIEPGRVLIAPGGMHFLVEEKMGEPVVMILPRNEAQRTASPSVDFAFTSMAPVFRKKLIGIVMTGMGRDGVAGCVAIRRFGGRVFCQDRETSMIFGMPGAVISEGLADGVVPVETIAETIERETEKIACGAEA